MTGSDSDAATDLEQRRRRLRFRAWHRGVKEADLILGQFVDAHVAQMDHDDLRWFERLFEEPDQDILAWILSSRPTPEPFDTAWMAALRKLDFLAVPGRA
ncbi:MAG: succinate dehydrogenase assembly factor 2 [Rhodothalassiaceae bacterium]